VLRDSTTLALRRREREPSTPSALEQQSQCAFRPRWADFVEKGGNCGGRGGLIQFL
jgi:hypothetical protein